VLGQGKRQSNNGLPITMAANDITFANGYNNMRKYGVSGGSMNNSMPTANQKLIQMNLNNSNQNSASNQQQHNFVVQGGNK